MVATARGHLTVGLLYGHAAAGAFIAASLSTQILVALVGAKPSVMDLPSISRVTKLPLDQLAQGQAWPLCQTLLTLHAMADEACAVLSGLTDVSVFLRNGSAARIHAPTAAAGVSVGIRPRHSIT